MASKHSAVAMASGCCVCQLLPFLVGPAVWLTSFAKMWREGDGQVLEQKLNVYVCVRVCGGVPLFTLS